MKKSNSENPENQNRNKRIGKNFQDKKPEIESPYIELEKLYTIDDMIDVWCRGCTNGATLWQYCQDNGKKLPSSFEAGLIELVGSIREQKHKDQALHSLINNNMLLLGVFDEKL